MAKEVLDKTAVEETSAQSYRKNKGMHSSGVLQQPVTVKSDEML